MRTEHPRILCVEEDPKALKALLYLLRSEKYHVMAASSVAKALEVIRKEPRLDMVIFSYAPTIMLAGNFPDPRAVIEPVNELQLVDAFRQKFADVPILFLLPEAKPDAMAGLSGIANSERLLPPYEPSYFLFVVKKGLDGGYWLTQL